MEVVVEWRKWEGRRQKKHFQGLSGGFETHRLHTPKALNADSLKGVKKQKHKVIDVWVVLNLFFFPSMINDCLIHNQFYPSDLTTDFTSIW